MPEHGLLVEGLRHRYGKTVALDGVSLQVAPGDVVCLLGPSGCGKSTLLRAAAGLERPEAGRIAIDGRVVSGDGTWVQPEKRGVGLVFQDYALFPHLTVLQNVQFGLQGMSGAAKRERACAVLANVGMEQHANAYPDALSGGQQQRVALARALAPRPPVMLLDEPFSGLDARLRDQVRDDTLHALKASGAAVLLVTHDPDEALLMADRVVLMRTAQVEQQGTPADLYLRPGSAYAARFLGDVNHLAGTVRGGRVATPLGSVALDGFADGTPLDVLVRPEAMVLSHPAGVGGTVRDVRLRGPSTLVRIEVTGEGGAHLEVRAALPTPAPVQAGQRVSVGFDPARAYFFPSSGASAFSS